MHTHNVMHMHGLRSLSANGLSNINKSIFIICVITVTFTTSFTLEVFTIFLFRYSFSLPTFKAYLYLSISFSVSLSIFSLFSHIHRHFSDMYTTPLSFPLALSSASLTYLLSSVVDPPVSFYFSLSLSISLYILCAPNQ